jgi:hypothetical protein
MRIFRRTVNCSKGAIKLDCFSAKRIGTGEKHGRKGVHGERGSEPFFLGRSAPWTIAVDDLLFLLETGCGPCRGIRHLQMIPRII